MSYTPDEKQQAVVKFEEKQVATMFGGDWAFVKALYPKFEPFNLALLFKMSQLYGLNPINREIYLLFTKNGPMIYVGKVGLTRKLNEAGGFSLSPYARGVDKEIGPLLDIRNPSKFSGTGFYVEVTITHKGHSITSRAYWDEHSPDELKPGSAWQKNPISMLEKAAFCKGARHLLGINEPAPEEMGLESISDEENQTSKIIEATMVEPSSGPTEIISDTAKQPEPRAITIWNNKVKMADEKIGPKATGNPVFQKEFVGHVYFKHPKHFAQHLEKHFGLKHPEDLTWDMLNVLHGHINGIKSDPRWYTDGPEVAKDPTSGWEGHNQTRALYEIKAAMDLYNEITEKYATRLGAAPAKWGKAMKDICEAIGVVYDLPISAENKAEIFAKLDKDIV